MENVTCVIFETVRGNYSYSTPYFRNYVLTIVLEIAYDDWKTRVKMVIYSRMKGKHTEYRELQLGLCLNIINY